MPNTVTVTLTLSNASIIALQLAVQKLNADMPGHPGVAELTTAVAAVAAPGEDATPAETPKAKSGQ